MLCIGHVVAIVGLFLLLESEAFPGATKSARILLYGVSGGLVVAVVIILYGIMRSGQEENLRRGSEKSSHSYEWFIAFSNALVFVYVIAYLEAAKHLASSIHRYVSQAAEAAGTPRPPPSVAPPIDSSVSVVSAIMLGLMVSFVVLYGSYVRSTRRLECAIEEAEKVDRDSEAGLDVHRPLVEHLRKVVYRREHLFEPPGNVFVTVGISATFLGLSIALVGLELPSLLGGTQTDPAHAVTKLTSFVGCMGLALGVSMLGVLIAMAAQVARGYGASDSTEDLIERVDHWLNPAKAARRRDARREGADGGAPATAGAPKPPAPPPGPPARAQENVRGGIGSEASAGGAAPPSPGSDGARTGLDFRKPGV